MEESQYRVIANNSQNKIANQKDYTQKEIEILEKKLVILNRKIDSLYEDKINGVLNIEDFKRIYFEANNTKSNLQKRIEDLKNNHVKEERVMDLGKIVNDFINMKEINKTMLVQLVDRITLSENKEITIYYKFNVLNNKTNEKINLIAV